MFDAASMQAWCEQGLSYEEFVALGTPDGHHLQWHDRYDRLALHDADRARLGAFTREMRILTLTGTWCGDCALQGASFARIAEGAPGRIHLRFLSRNDHADLQVKVPINGGFRVPVTFFLAEDFEPVARFGDRTLSRYRSMARKALAPGTPEVAALAPAPDDPVRAVLAEVLDEVERVQLLLRLSPRLRQRHGD
ncbi:MAG: thioredoxin family protein [Phycisphaerales bacterium]|nr:thioredoxin family protein [Phycisphaerales bacterium]